MELLPVRLREPGFITLRDQIDRLFNNFATDFPGWPDLQRNWAPSVDIGEDDKNIFVKVELPGIPAEAIEISVANHALTIQGEKQEDKEEKGKTWTRKERFYGKFSRTIPLPEGIDANKVDAVDKAGVLTITLPKLETAKARKIKVKTV